MGKFVDVHSHVLPGVDDGIQSLGECIASLKEYERLGFGNVFCTSHQKQYSINPEIETLKQVYEAVCDENPTGIKLHTGAENYFDDQFLGRLRRTEVPVLGNSQYFLFELPPTIPVRHLDRIVYEMSLSGYMPVLAHIERYPWLKLEEIKSIRNNIIISANITTLLKKLTPVDKQKRLIKLLKLDYIDIFTTDLHSYDFFPGIEKAINWAYKNLGDDVVEKLLVENPMKIVNDAEK
ncbi:MAG: hypothetical protein JXR95_01055 [Deltaproteobacteria bacterium]|nr:hypothetical protein [Deltaproteobacteria bacterium]